ncbi:MAG TPA: Dps family protein [Haloplasmataceae bacterium]
MNQALIELLNKEVANCTVMYMKLHNFHWFIKGSHFFALHEKFEELYDEITDFLDQIAERILMLNHKPLATLQSCLSQSTIKEIDEVKKEDDMIRILIEDYETIRQELVQGITLANENGDDVTSDLLIQMKAKLDKHIWMFKALLDKN